MSENKATRYYPGRDWPIAKSQAQLVAEGNFETCCECGGETGKAGRGEDSLYCPECDAGPFCPQCYDNHMVGEYEPLVERLRAENAALAGERNAVETLLLDNGYGGAGFASLADAIDATLGELRRLERIVGVPQPERVPWERRVEEVLTRAEAAEAERDRLAAELKTARTTIREGREWCEWHEGPCDKCQVTEYCPFPWPDTVPWMRVNEEPTDAD